MLKLLEPSARIRFSCSSISTSSLAAADSMSLNPRETPWVSCCAAASRRRLRCLQTDAYWTMITDEYSAANSTRVTNGCPRDNDDIK
jgi:hypothetical protein